MKYIVEKLTKNEELESKIKVLCSFKVVLKVLNLILSKEV